MITITEAIEDYIVDTPELDAKRESESFERVLNFIINLEPEQLTDEQLDEVVSIIDMLEFQGEDGISEVIRAKKSTAEKKREARQFWRRNKAKIKLRRKKFKLSAKGRKRKQLKKRMEKVNKTPLGRKRIQYNVVKGKKDE